MLDVSQARRHFPALEGDWALLDNAGGSVPPRQVIEQVADYMARTQVQHGASYPHSREAVVRVQAGRLAAARLVGAEPDEIVLGPSSTVLARRLADALRPLLRPGDEVIVTDLDHEANNGPWRALAGQGIVVREWRLRPASATLELADLQPLLGPRTRLVAFTHVSNVVGTIHDAAAITRAVHAAGAWVCVDGVAFAPHRRVDVKALDADFYLVSLYKVYGPHISLLYGKREHLLRLASQNHFFFGEGDLPYKLEPGGVTHELAASLPGILDYFADLRGLPGAQALDPTELDALSADFAAHEAALVRPLLEFLVRHPRVRLVGSADPDPRRRVPTVAFTVDGMPSSAVPPRLEERRVAIRFGHFYAIRATRALDLADGEGVVRASLVHYNTRSEVERLIEALEEVLPR